MGEDGSSFRGLEFRPDRKILVQLGLDGLLGNFRIRGKNLLREDIQQSLDREVCALRVFVNYRKGMGSLRQGDDLTTGKPQFRTLLCFVGKPTTSTITPSSITGLTFAPTNGAYPGQIISQRGNLTHHLLLKLRAIIIFGIVSRLMTDGLIFQLEIPIIL